MKDGNKLCWVTLGRWGWPNDSWRLSTDGPRSTVSFSSNHYYQYPEETPVDLVGNVS